MSSHSSVIIAIKEPKDLDAKNLVTHNDLKSKQPNEVSS
ncbi:hypothetical protein BXY64_4252 [Marinifilum flexuosum]|uniref:Uncharacterized protein n=1 Tax=Marinifilum flexuosum TaxID=1117708 RepID=A0A419WF17_9BACT|nr:hypothetical protein BXY64_4252 [Marinifilum flexuosum]